MYWANDGGHQDSSTTSDEDFIDDDSHPMSSNYSELDVDSPNSLSYSGTEADANEIFDIITTAYARRSMRRRGYNESDYYNSESSGDETPIQDDDDVNDGSDTNNDNETNDEAEMDNELEVNNENEANEAQINNDEEDILIIQEIGSVINNEPSEQTIKKIKLDNSITGKLSNEDDEVSDDQKCPICLDAWSNYGEHRLCSLRCGHLFGHMCIVKWFAQAANAEARRCPECNTKAAKKDIRILYAKKLSCIDTTEIEQMKEQLKQAERKHSEAEASLSRHKINAKVMEGQMKRLQERVNILEKALAVSNGSKSIEDQILKARVFEVCSFGSCRVMAYNEYNKILVMSSKVLNQDSSAHGFSKLYLDTMTLIPSYKNHNNVIRDMAFHSGHPNFLLSVAFDKRVALTDIRHNTLLHSYEAPANLWSCCWSGNNTSAFYAGSQNGQVMEYDIRSLESHVRIWENTSDRSPVVSLAAIPSSSRTVPGGGFITCQLNSCMVYALKEGCYASYTSKIDGPFTSLRYDKKNDHALISCRANAKNQRVRQIVCSVEKCSDDVKFNVVHTFDTGSTQKLLSRPCHMYTKDDTLIVANNESLNSVLLWSVSTGIQRYNLALKEPVVDTCSFRNDSQDCTQLAILTSKGLHLYNHPEKVRSALF